MFKNYELYLSQINSKLEDFLKDKNLIYIVKKGVQNVVKIRNSPIPDLKSLIF